MLIHGLSHPENQRSKGVFMKFRFRTIGAFVLASLVHYSQAQTAVVTGSVSGASHDARLPREQRIDEILRKMTLEEKIRMCFGGTQLGVSQLPGVPRLGIPAMMASDGPRGVTATHGSAFPSGIGMAMSWDPHLMEETGRVIGQEARAGGISVKIGRAHV